MKNNDKNINPIESEIINANVNETTFINDKINIGTHVIPSIKLKKSATSETTENESEIYAESQKETSAETTESEYDENELYILSHVIYGEAGDCSWEHQLYTGSVVLNRVKSKRYPSTIEDVVFQKGQYACTWDGNYNKTPSKRSVEVAKYLLDNGSQIPYYVLYQAEFKQGDGVWLHMGDTYFCYEERDK